MDETRKASSRAQTHKGLGCGSGKPIKGGSQLDAFGNAGEEQEPGVRSSLEHRLGFPGSALGRRRWIRRRPETGWPLSVADLTFVALNLGIVAAASPRIQ